MPSHVVLFRDEGRAKNNVLGHSSPGLYKSHNSLRLVLLVYRTILEYKQHALPYLTLHYCVYIAVAIKIY